MTDNYVPFEPEKEGVIDLNKLAEQQKENNDLQKQLEKNITEALKNDTSTLIGTKGNETADTIKINITKEDTTFLVSGGSPEKLLSWIKSDNTTNSTDSTNSDTTASTASGTTSATTKVRSDTLSFSPKEPSSSPSTN